MLTVQLEGCGGMGTPVPLALTSSCRVAAPARAVWIALTTPAPMQRWMLAPGSFVPDAPLMPGSRIEWRDAHPEPYLVGTATVCEIGRRLMVALQDRSWPRQASEGEVTWSFDLTQADGANRVDCRLGNLAIDPEAQGWLEAYRDADEPARLAAVVREFVR